MWSHKIKYESKKNKGRITNKIWDGKKGWRVVLLVFIPPVKKAMLRPCLTFHILEMSALVTEFSSAFNSLYQLHHQNQCKIFSINKIKKYVGFSQINTFLGTSCKCLCTHFALITKTSLNIPLRIIEQSNWLPHHLFVYRLWITESIIDCNITMEWLITPLLWMHLSKSPLFS